MRETAKAKQLQTIQAKEAEYIVQKEILETARELKIPLTVFRGVETHKHLGRHLEKFDFQFTKPSQVTLKSL